MQSQEEIKCPREGCNNKARIHTTYGVLPCQSCIDTDRKTAVATAPEFATQSQTNRIQEQRDKFAKDIIQPWTTGNRPNVDFVKAYPKKAKDYFSPDQLRKL